MSDLSQILFSSIEKVIKNNLEYFSIFQEIATKKSEFSKSSKQYKTEGWFQAMLVYEFSKQYFVIPEYYETPYSWDLAVWDEIKPANREPDLVIEIKCYASSQNLNDIKSIKTNLSKFKGSNLASEKYFLLLLPESDIFDKKNYSNKIKKSFEEDGYPVTISLIDYPKNIFKVNGIPLVGLIWVKVT
ncbi:MAG: hypothetical protein IPO03_05235 [Bacteroidetes bacterium]|nr:hypothetical protein [Bacteroidota bacterium]